MFPGETSASGRIPPEAGMFHPVTNCFVFFKLTGMFTASSSCSEPATHFLTIWALLSKPITYVIKFITYVRDLNMSVRVSIYGKQVFYPEIITNEYIEL
jgi:hypothetical protein